MNKIAAIAILLATLLLAVTSFAAPPAPVSVPVVTLVALSGEDISTETLGGGKPMVLVLIRKGEAGGEALLKLMEGWEKPLPAERVYAVVEGADRDLVQSMASRHANLRATWFSDQEELLLKGLQYQTSPAVVGIVQGKVAWTVYGTQNAEQMEKIVRGWVNR